MGLGGGTPAPGGLAGQPLGGPCARGGEEAKWGGVLLGFHLPCGRWTPPPCGGSAERLGETLGLPPPPSFLYILEGFEGSS